MREAEGAGPSAPSSFVVFGLYSYPRLAPLSSLALVATTLFLLVLALFVLARLSLCLLVLMLLLVPAEFLRGSERLVALRTAVRSGGLVLRSRVPVL